MKNMTRYLIFVITLFITSCGKDFLTVNPIEDLTGRNYWQTKKDAEMFVRDLYSNFRYATMDHAFFPSTGDFRCAPIIPTPGSNGAGYFMNHLRYLPANNLDGLFAQYWGTSRSYSTNTEAVGNSDYFGFKNIRNWSRFYSVIQKSNIAIYYIDKMESSVMSDIDKKRMIAEATFMRNLSYFFLVRLFGDVPYYTEAFAIKPLGRTDMIIVLENIYQDMLTNYKDLPWSYDDITLVGNKAMRGGALALMMHTNMWLAGFSSTNKSQYYERVVQLGKELIEDNGGAYTLLPLSETKEIFKGRTKEGLFEIAQNYNYGELFDLSATFSDYVLIKPYKVVERSYFHYDPDFLKEMYPENVTDARKMNWFNENIYATDGKFMILKYANVFKAEGEDNNPDDNQIVFRYVDAYLLKAEAEAELGFDTEATQTINIVRSRAQATPFTGISGEDLKDAIWWERTRELVGEGHFFYDLVRTKKVLNSKYTKRTISVGAFNQRAWTWPIDNSAFVNNPFMTPNTYWNN